MTLTKSLIMTLLVAFLSVGALGCAKEEGPAERAGSALDEAVGDAKESMEEAAEDAGDAIEDAGDDVEEAMEY